MFAELPESYVDGILTMEQHSEVMRLKPDICNDRFPFNDRLQSPTYPHTHIPAITDIDADDFYSNQCQQYIDEPNTNHTDSVNVAEPKNDKWIEEYGGKSSNSGDTSTISACDFEMIRPMSSQHSEYLDSLKRIYEQREQDNIHEIEQWQQDIEMVEIDTSQYELDDVLNHSNEQYVSEFNHRADLKQSHSIDTFLLFSLSRISLCNLNLNIGKLC